MKSRQFFLIIGYVLLACSQSFAQSPQSQQPQRVPDGGIREVLVSILIPSLPNEPFSATVNTEWIRQLADGTTITLKNHRAIARDRAGRIFQERRLLVPDDGKHDSPVTQIEMSDPVSGELYICTPDKLTCQLETFSGSVSAAPPAAAVIVPRKGPGGSAVEDLGKQFIGELEAFGAREITVIETGVIGNDGPLLTKREFWYSPRLGVNLISKRQDPRFGIQKFELSDLTLGEPDTKLFQLSGGGKIIDLRNSSEIQAPKSAPSN
jgi:hypothetical protein